MWEKIRRNSFLLFQGTFVPLTGDQVSGNVQLAPFLTQAFQSGSLPDFFNAAFQSAIAIGAILAVLRIAYAGFMYMASEVWSSKEKAKTILQQSILGLVLLSAIWLILYQINPQILDLNFLQGITPATPATGT